MKIIEYFSVNNDCYKKNVNKADSRYTKYQENGPKGIMIHSIGCPQDEAIVLAKTWNRSNYDVAVHAVLQADGTVYQCLPWGFRGWHAGGDANNTHIGVEMTEPDCIKYVGGATFTCSNIEAARKQVAGTYKTAVELFAYLCKMYGLNPLADGVIISHAEGYKRGIASGHADPEHLWNQLGTGYTMDGFRKDIFAAMNSTPNTTPTAKTYYRVRKSWEDASSQIGAFVDVNNAKSFCDRAGDGYYVFDASGKAIYPIVPDKKSVEEIAREVIQGKWSNGATRVKKLTDAGYNYDEVQDAVNAILLGKKPSAPTKKSVEEVAREVIQGKWGNGAQRKQKLEEAGYNYSEVQGKVNELL